MYKLLVYGCKKYVLNYIFTSLCSNWLIFYSFLSSGQCVAYKHPDDYGSLSFSHKYGPTSKENEHASVVHLKWSPDYRVLCAIYDNGTFCLFSVFGALLFDSKDLL